MRQIIKSVLICILYFIVTALLSIVLYLTLGKYLFSNSPENLGLIDTLIYCIVLILVLLISKKTKILPNIQFTRNSFKIPIVMIVLLAIFYSIAIDPLFRFDMIFGDTNFADLKNSNIKSFNQKAFKFINLIMLVPVVEEYVFRGVILKTLLNNRNKVFSVLFSSFLFALIHINYYPFSFDIISVLSAFILGTVTTIVYLKSNLFGAIIFHSVFNLFWYFSKYLLLDEYWSIIKKLDFGLLYWFITIFAAISFLFVVTRKINSQKQT